MTIPKLYQWTKRLSFRAFLVGFISTLICLSLLGRWYSQQNPYQNFVRFHQLIHPEALYYPTISQLRAIAKEKLQDRSQIGVIVGGSSIFNGVSQSPDKIWTEHLQELLGDRYRVINFAFRGGWAQGGGAIAAQSLLDEGYKIIFTADTILGLLAPDGTKIYDYFIWDALYKGLIKAYPPLIQEIEKTQAGESRYSELKLRMWLDSLFYSNDLWTSIAYQYVFTVWSSLIAGNAPTASFTKPRSQMVDPEIKYKPKPASERYEAVEEQIKNVNDIAHSEIIRLCEQVYEWKQDKWVVKPVEVDDRLKHGAKIAFPETFRSHTLIVMLYGSPYYFETIDSRYRDCWEKGTHLLINELQKIGYWATEVGRDLLGEDYADFLHLVPSGGVKLAETVAPKIQQIAANQGYLK